jgi:hypothetical protein
MDGIDTPHGSNNATESTNHPKTCDEQRLRIDCLEPKPERRLPLESSDPVEPTKAAWVIALHRTHERLTLCESMS